MPVYEYAPVRPVCGMCPDRFAVIQSASEAPLESCPFCGMDVTRLVSGASFRIAKGEVAGFTTFKRAESGVWEKVSGDGVDVLEATPEDRAAVATKPPKLLDL